eukprot:538239_1
MSTFGREWAVTYRPSYNNGSFGSYYYNDEVNFYPQQISQYIPSKKDETYINSQFHQTLKHISFDINAWYPFLKDYTFPTAFLTITPTIAQSIVNFYRAANCRAIQNRLTKTDIENLRSLQKKLDQQIKSCINKWYGDDMKDNNAATNAVFIRFSYRSPKDGAKMYEINPIKLLMDGRIKNENNSDDNEANIQFIEFCKILRNNVMVSDGKDAMSLILSSERIFVDMLSIIRAHKFPFKYLFHKQFTKNIVESKEEKENINDVFDICDVQIAIRKWNKLILDDMEFRCFVYDKQLKAITQYNQYCYYKHLANNEQYIGHIKDAIIKYFNEYIKYNVPNWYINYCIDIAVIENSNVFKCIVIELGPLSKGITGLCLFKWNDHFEHQLKYAKDIEIRIKKENNLRNDFVQHWLEEASKTYYECQQTQIQWHTITAKDEKSNDCVCL